MTDRAQQLEKQHHTQLYKRYPITLVEGEGARVRDSEGREYIDALAGIAVNSLGHAHPAVVEAIRHQAGRLIHASNLFYMEPQSELAERLTRLAGLDRVFFTNSGTEAMEGAIKLARRLAGKQGRGGDIISFEGCFHGRSIGALSTHSDKQRQAFEPLLPGFRQVPFNEMDALEEAMGDDTTAVIIEAVQGEGGVRPVEADFMRRVRELCDRHGALMIADEIQCGVARTGKMFGYQHAGVLPDIVTLAKALGSGVPIGAVLAKQSVADAFEFGDHGTTFGGNALVCAAADATLKTIEQEKLDQRAAELGNYMLEVLRDAAREHPSIQEVRGRGLMVGVELDIGCKGIVAEMMERGVLANCTQESVVRFLPPLIISRDDLKQVIEVFLDVLGEAEKEDGQL